MIYLLTSLVLMEGGIAIALMLPFTPFQNLLMKWVDVFIRSKGLAVIKTVGLAMVMAMAAIINSILKVKRRTKKMGSPTLADQYLLFTYILEASLIGYALFLGFIINGLHHYLCELASTKVNLEALEKQAKATEAGYMRLKAENESSKENAEKNSAAFKEIKSLKNVIAELRHTVEKLQIDIIEKDEAAKAAEANAMALQKQSEGFLLEYDRLLEDNQQLRGQLASFDRRGSFSDNKKRL